MKHRILMLTMIAVLLLPISLLMLTPARVAHAATCTPQSGSTIVSITINISANTGDTITVTTTGLASVSIMIIFPPPGGFVMGTGNASAIVPVGGIVSVNLVPVPFATPYSYTITCSSGGSTGFTDGRCNLEADQSVAVYPDGQGGYEFYAIYKDVGYFALQLTKADLDASPDTGKTYLIGKAKGVQVYRLAGGALQVKRLKADKTTYVYTWSSCG